MLRLTRVWVRLRLTRLGADDKGLGALGTKGGGGVRIGSLQLRWLTSQLHVWMCAWGGKGGEIPISMA